MWTERLIPLTHSEMKSRFTALDLRAVVNELKGQYCCTLLNHFN